MIGKKKKYKLGDFNYSLPKKFISQYPEKMIASFSDKVSSKWNRFGKHTTNLTEHCKIIC